MTKKDLNNWIMFHEIHRLKRLGFSKAKIARFLVLDPRTITRYLAMSENEFEQYLVNYSQRKKVLDPYETFVANNLSEYPETSAAQIHDWLKEGYDDFPEVSSRTVYNYVMFIRHKYNIPYEYPTRDFFPVEELPYGQQAQVDFGEYNMRGQDNRRKKVYFFAMVLSRSRMKFTWFSDKPFTAHIVIIAHEKAFEFFGGIVKMIVYDQDRVIIVDENLGDIILTAAFKQYTRTRNFELHFCRKADPQSKGKVENVIQYIKKNFLYNRVYHDIETLNEQAVAWLGRTANYLPHNSTKKPPREEFLIEKEYLNAYKPLILKGEPEMIKHTVRKNNVIAYKSNFYTLPEGTYQGPGTLAMVKKEQEALFIYDLKEQLICTHQVSHEKGKTIRNSHHKRDTSKSIEEMSKKVAGYFTDQTLANDYIAQIKQKWPRYIRDHLQVILKAITKADMTTADKTLNFCLENNILHGYDFEQALYVFIDEKVQNIKPQDQIKLLNKNNLQNMEHTPKTSNIEDYENIINQ